MTGLPAGYRFCPTDEELINFYLSRKLRGEILPQNLVNDCNLYEYEPSELYGTNSTQNFYVFVKLKKNGKMTQRRAVSGTWIGQNNFDVKDQDGRVIGAKKLLNFKDKITGMIWIMHELYSLECDDLVVCRIRNKDAEKSVDKCIHPNKRITRVITKANSANPVNCPKNMTHNSMCINANPVLVHPQGDIVVRDQPEIDNHHDYINGNSCSMNGIDMVQFNTIQNANLPFKEKEPLTVEPIGKPLAAEGTPEGGQITHVVQENQNYYTNSMNCSSKSVESEVLGWSDLGDLSEEFCVPWH